MSLTVTWSRCKSCNKIFSPSIALDCDAHFIALRKTLGRYQNANDALSDIESMHKLDFNALKICTLLLTLTLHCTAHQVRLFDI